MPDAFFRIRIEGGVDLGGMPGADLKDRMKNAAAHAIEKGMITSDSPAKLDECEIRAAIMELLPVANFCLTFSGYLCLNGHSKESLEKQIDQEVMRFVDLGLISGDTLAELTDFEVSVRITRTSGWRALKHEPAMGM